MTSFKKYLLIDPEKYDQLLTKVNGYKDNNILVHPNIKAVKEIDNKISSILNDDLKSDQQKVDEYSSKLDSYLRSFRNALEVTKKDAILGQTKHDAVADDPPQSVPVQGKSYISDEKSSKESIPPSYRPSASHLTSFLTKNKNFEISDNGELKYKGKRQFHSDYPKLLDSVVRFRKPSSGSKTEVNDFVTLLRQEGYPVTRLGYVRRNNIQTANTKENNSSSIDSKGKKPKLQKDIDRLSSGTTPKKKTANTFSSAKIYQKWEKV